MYGGFSNVDYGVVCEFMCGVEVWVVEVGDDVGVGVIVFVVVDFF